MNLKYLLIWLSASMLIGCGCAAALSFSGETVQLTGNQTEDIIWNESNFGGFCYNQIDDACTGTETLTIEAGALEGPDIDRFIDVGNLTYTTSPIWQEYELHKNLGLTVESGRCEVGSGYRTEFWMGERCVAVCGNANDMDMRTWWWVVNLSEPSTGFRIWDANREPPMDLNYMWDARSCTGFYYDPCSPVSHPNSLFSSINNFP